MFKPIHETVTWVNSLNSLTIISTIPSPPPPLPPPHAHTVSMSHMGIHSQAMPPYLTHAAHENTNTLGQPAHILSPQNYPYGTMPPTWGSHRVHNVQSELFILLLLMTMSPSPPKMASDTCQNLECHPILSVLHFTSEAALNHDLHLQLLHECTHIQTYTHTLTHQNCLLES